MTALKDSIKNSWEVRSLRFILRMMAALLCVGYVLATLGGAVGWLEMKRVRLADADSLPAYAAAAIADRDPDAITRWISLRPVSERADIIRALEPYYGSLSSPAFLVFSKWERLAGRTDDGLFWYQLARYRLRYDALRCGFASATDDMTGFIDMGMSTDVEADILLRPDFTVTSLRRVLDFDARHPADNVPHGVCAQLAKVNGVKLNVLPVEKWADIRHTLRLVTEYALTRIEKDNQKKKKPVKRL